MVADQSMVNDRETSPPLANIAASELRARACRSSKTTTSIEVGAHILSKDRYHAPLDRLENWL
jgi:hypothetical protein